MAMGMGERLGVGWAGAGLPVVLVAGVGSRCDEERRGGWEQGGGGTEGVLVVCSRGLVSYAENFN